MTTPALPKGAATTTAHCSKWFFWSFAVLIVVLLALLLSDSGGRLWVHVLLVASFAVQAAMYFRSWRILRRFEADQ